MKIAIDGVFLNNLSCGTGQYSYQLLKGLNLIDRENEYLIFSPFENELDFKLGANFCWRRVKIPNLGKNLNKFFWEQLYLLFSLRKKGLDILHSPYTTAPFFKTVRRHLVTIHDVIGFKFPEYRRQLKWRLYYWFIKKPLQKTDLVITVSEFSRQEIKEVLKIDQKMIKVIYGSVDLSDYSGEVERVRQKYNLKRKFILSVSCSDPRKNTHNLIKAYNMTELINFCDLVIINGDREYQKENVRFFYDLPKEDLAGFYKAAEFMVYPSLYEGFGLPVLEAMESGCPVIASNTSSIPEVVGEAGLLVSSYFPESISFAMESLFENPDLRKTLIARGRQQAKKFSWLKMAKATLECYRSLI